MTDLVSEPNTHRRTQAERRNTTRAALLDATIDALAEHGYVGVTTADIARRVGMTRGAQTHHFGSKSELVTAAMRRLADQLIQEFNAQVRVGSRLVDRDPSRSLELVLDRLWELHRGQLFSAAFELWLAARTDDELRPALHALELDLLDRMSTEAAHLLPRIAAHPRFAGLLSTTTATMRGLAMLTFIHADVAREWRAARQHLITLWGPLIEGAFRSRVQTPADGSPP